MSLARQVELMENERPMQPPPWAAPRGPPPLAPRAALPVPPPLLALPVPPAATQQARGDGGQRRLTPDEMAERRRLGLCFNCNEKYTRGHNRVCRRIFFVDGVEINTAEGDNTGAAADTGDAPVFSLHAVAGVTMARTVRIQVTIGSTPLIALLDTGSTHNFIAEDTAVRSGLPIQSRPRLKATVANGEKVPCPGVIRSAPLVVQDDVFIVDLFVMPLAGFDVILGMQWMATLGCLV